jgi:hypothetical protein
MQTSATCYSSASGKPGGSLGGVESKKGNGGKMINLEEELCMLIYENNQLKNCLKEKEDVIQLLQSKVRTTKLKLLQGSGQQSSGSSAATAATNTGKSMRLNSLRTGANNNNLESLNDVIAQKLNINYSTINVKATNQLNGSFAKSSNAEDEQLTVSMNKHHFQTIDKQQQLMLQNTSVNNQNSSAQLLFSSCNHDSGFEIDASSSSANNSTSGMNIILIYL